MKKLLLISAINLSSIVANSQIGFVDFDEVIGTVQATSGVRRLAAEGQAKLQASEQKWNEHKLEAEKALMDAYGNLQKSGATSTDSVKSQEIDATTKLEVEKVELKAQQNKLQLEVASKLKSLEPVLRGWANDFRVSEGLTMLFDRRPLSADPGADFTKQFVLFCDKKYALEVKKGDLLAKNSPAENSSVVDFSKTQKNTVLAKADTQASGVVTA